MTLGLIIGLLAGLLIGLALFFFTSPKLMFKEDPSPLGFQETVEKVEKAVEEKGWKLPAVHDLQATMKTFGKDVRSVKVFEVCNPDLAYRILSQDDERIVSNMMPCRLAVYERTDGTVWISRMNSGLVSKPMSSIVRKTMTLAAREMEEIIEVVLEP